MNFSLGTPQPSPLGQVPAKIEHLHRLALLGLPVPPGWACKAQYASKEIENNILLDDLLSEGSVIVRMAFDYEDLPNACAAGLGLSIRKIQRHEQITQALTTLQEHCKDPWLREYQSKIEASYWVLIQRELPRKWLIVAAIDAQGTIYIEAHSSPMDVLHAGSCPNYSGPLTIWDDQAVPKISDVCQKVAGYFSKSNVGHTHGLDLELIVDTNDQVWLVQARPLSANLIADTQEFVTTAIDPLDPQTLSLLSGLFVLDAEHNPAPLSPAHAWLIDTLRRDRPKKAGDPIALAGWLYLRTLPRHLDSHESKKLARDPIQALRYLERSLIPSMQDQCKALVQQIDSCSRATLAEGLALAHCHFLTMIDAYLEHIVPNRGKKTERIGDSENPLSLRDRARFLDVLPTSWDLASESLHDLGISEVAGITTSEKENADDVNDSALADSLLSEWDDHLFALGIVPLRKIWLRAAQLLGINSVEVFFLTGTELGDWSSGSVALEQAGFLQRLIEQRQQQERHHRQLAPPLRLFNGKPIPILSSAFLHGFACGEDYKGSIAVYSSLEQLLDNPPHQPTIVCLPSLTAQAAVALHHLKIQAVCTEYGGVLGHGALMARELGLSALIGCRGCTSLTDHTLAKIDSKQGRLLVHG